MYLWDSIFPVKQTWIVLDRLLSLFDDKVRIERTVKTRTQSVKWRVYANDGNRFALMGEYDTFDTAFQKAKGLRPK